jgi:hypothetical protein
MYDPTHPSSTPTAAVAPAAARPRREAAVFDTVKVSPDTFRSVLFMGSAERKEFTTDNRPNRDKPQKRTTAGVPVWSVQVAAINWRGNSNLVTVTVPMHDDPAQKFIPGQPVELVDLVFGVSPKRSNGGYVTWCSADGINPAGAGMTAA